MRKAASLVLAAAAAFGAGYGAGLLATMPPGPAPAGAGAGTPPPAATSGEEGGGGPYYVEVGQLVVPVLAEGRTLAFILTQITLEAAGPDQANAVRRRLPHARSALLQTLYGLAGSGFFDGRSVDPAAAAAALRQGVNEPLGGAVRTVLIDRLLRQDNSRL